MVIVDCQRIFRALLLLNVRFNLTRQTWFLIYSQFHKSAVLSYVAVRFSPLRYDAIASEDDEHYHLDELWQLFALSPHALVPFEWTDSPDRKRSGIPVQGNSNTPRFSWLLMLRR